MQAIPARRRTAAVALATAMTALAGAPAAGAQVTASSASTAPGTATTLSWSVDGLAEPVAGRLPASVAMVAPGFTLDRRAVTRRCTRTRAELDECPAKSRLGTGLLHIVVHRENGEQNEIAFDTTLYQGRARTKVLAVTDFIGIRVVPGALKADETALRLAFDLPEPPAIPGVVKGYSLKEVAVDLGVTRKVTRKVKRRRRTTRYSLVHTPAQCVDGAWATTMSLGYPDGASSLLDAPMTCEAAR